MSESPDDTYDIYLGWDPARTSGMENIKLEAGLNGSRVAEQDCQAREIVRDKETMRELAKREFIRWWKTQKSDYPLFLKEDPESFDTDVMQRLYAHDFIESYESWSIANNRDAYEGEANGFQERVLPPMPTGPTARVVSSYRFEGNRIYKIELADPDYLYERLVFEVEVDNEGEATLEECD